jgi:hypothetical protein
MMTFKRYKNKETGEEVLALNIKYKITCSQIKGEASWDFFLVKRKNKRLKTKAFNPKDFLKCYEPIN